VGSHVKSGLTWKGTTGKLRERIKIASEKKQQRKEGGRGSPVLNGKKTLSGK